MAVAIEIGEVVVVCRSDQWLVGRLRVMVVGRICVTANSCLVQNGWIPHLLVWFVGRRVDVAEADCVAVVVYTLCCLIVAIGVCLRLISMLRLWLLRIRGRHWRHEVDAVLLVMCGWIAVPVLVLVLGLVLALIRREDIGRRLAHLRERVLVALVLVVAVYRGELR